MYRDEDEHTNRLKGCFAMSLIHTYSLKMSEEGRKERKQEEGRKQREGPRGGRSYIKKLFIVHLEFKLCLG
jgi:hypothetical protein